MRVKQETLINKNTAKSASPAAESKTAVLIPEALTVKQLADLLDVSPVEVIKSLMRNGVMANINQIISYENAARVAVAAGLTPREAPRSGQEAAAKFRASDEEAAAQVPRPPVVTIMGHVDHGKTSLLDAIRKTNVAGGEAGSITQHIGAYQVEINGQKITFLDTPGHEAFTAMRARGAKATDIAVLVVAADDGVMPQTQEAIDHAKAAGVPIVVALNKMDKPSANPDKVKQQLADHGVLIEEWGGDVIAVPVSAKKKEGIPVLLENLLIVAEMQELKANPNRAALGVVIEARLDTTKGPLATVLIQTGTLKVGDVFVAGNTWGKVKAMFDDKGKQVRKAEPATPVGIMGFNSVPQAGDVLTVVAGEKEARERAQRAGGQASRAQKLSDLAAQIQAGQVKELNIILKTDVQGSIEPIRTSLGRTGSDRARARVIHAATGNITENDVLLAVASKGIILGFNTRVEPGAKRLAENEGVEIRIYQVIYTMVEDVERALAGLLEPTYAEVVEGHGEVIALFNIKHGKVAGVRIIDGKVSRNNLARVVRKGQVVHDGSINSLRRFQENVKECTTGLECGVLIDDFSTYEVGDVIEAYRKEKSS